MKYLLVLAVVALAYTLWKHNRQSEMQAGKQAPQRPKPNTPATMVACKHCGVMLPESEAVKGQTGVYCGEAHRKSAES